MSGIGAGTESKSFGVSEFFMAGAFATGVADGVVEGESASAAEVNAAVVFP